MGEYLVRLAQNHITQILALKLQRSVVMLIVDFYRCV
jgi:hypothetical protein